MNLTAQNDKKYLKQNLTDVTAYKIGCLCRDVVIFAMGRLSCDKKVCHFEKAILYGKLPFLACTFFVGFEIFFSLEKSLVIAMVM